MASPGYSGAMTNHGEHSEAIFTYEAARPESLSEAVVAAVAAAADVDPVGTAGSPTETDGSLDPLYTAIDPDALDSVFRATDPDRTGRVTFSYHGHEGTARHEGRVTVRPLERAAGGTSD